MWKNCYTCSFIKKYTKILVSIFFLLMFVFALNIIAIGKSYSTYIQQQLNYNMYKYNEVDLEQLCRISNCSYVISKGEEEKIYSAYHGSAKGIWIHRDDQKKVELTHLFDEYFIDNKYNILLYNEKADAFFALDLDIFIEELKMTYLVTFLFVYFIVSIFQYFSFQREQKEHMIQTIGSEAILSNQSMILITENVHHEMNTPMEVIDNKLEKIHRLINEFTMNELKVYETEGEKYLTPERVKLNKKMVAIDKDFEYIKLAIEQVFATLDKMRGFKHLRYSNGNKNLYDICHGACKIISISNSGFEYHVDEELKNYKIKPNGVKTMKNVDLLNVIINHLKNSLEAKSSEILIRLSHFEDEVARINIVDNGNGIPKNVVNHVFKPNYSTKMDNENIRGNGMYLNKYILNASGGDVSIIDSNINGTIIGISVPACFKEFSFY